MLNQAIPNDPEWIYNNAIRYKQNKDRVTSIRNSILGAPKLSFIDNIDKTAQDLGAATGLGITMAGAKLNQSTPLKDLGMGIKGHGINTLLKPNMRRMYGYGIPIAGAVGIGAGIKAGWPEWENDD